MNPMLKSVIFWKNSGLRRFCRVKRSKRHFYDSRGQNTIPKYPMLSILNVEIFSMNYFCSIFIKIISYSESFSIGSSPGAR